MVQNIDESASDERQDSDYDGAWKEAFRFHLSEFIERCFPSLAKLIDWTFDPEWLDKEISQIIGQSGHRNRQVDLLFKVRLLDGNEQWILCHLEIQTSYEADFARRIDLYNAGLKWLFRQEVMTLVILADLSLDWRPSEHRFVIDGFESYRRFPVCKVLDRLANDWSDETSLVLEVARAQIAALRTASDPEARFDAKTQLVRNLYTAGYNANDIRELFRLIDWMMHLRRDLDRKFKVELAAFEKELQMPYVTSVERLAKEEGLEEGLEKGLQKGLQKGREEGREEGSITILLLQLSDLFGLVPEDIEQRIRQLSLEQIQVLSRALLKFRSIADLENWLNTTMN